MLKATGLGDAMFVLNLRFSQGVVSEEREPPDQPEPLIKFPFQLTMTNLFSHILIQYGMFFLSLEIEVTKKENTRYHFKNNLNKLLTISL